MARTDISRTPGAAALCYPGLHFFPGRRMYAVPLLVLCADALWLWLSPHRLLPGPAGLLALAAGACLALALFWLWLARTPRVRQSEVHRRRREIVSLFLQAAVFLIATANALVLFGHLSMTLALPYADGLLHGWDRALGLDWVALLRLCAESPLWRALSFHAHVLLGPACVLGLAALLLLQEVERARFFLVALALTAVACTGAGTFFPVRGAVAHVALAEAPGLLLALREWPGLERWPGYAHAGAMADLRSGAPLRIDLGALGWPAAFPSLHAAAGVVFACSCRGTLLFWPAALFAAVGLLAAPVWGGHYVVGALAGALVALGVCLGVGRLLRPGQAAAQTQRACNRER